MLEVGRVCIKIAGRDAGQTAIVVEKIDEKTVLIDGNVRRRKCNINHLEPLDQTVKVSKGASTSEVHKAMSSSKLKVLEKKKVKRSKKKETKKEETKEKKVKETTKKK